MNLSTGLNIEISPEGINSSTCPPNVHLIVESGEGRGRLVRRGGRRQVDVGKMICRHISYDW
jgi:hypothetical protein